MEFASRVIDDGAHVVAVAELVDDVAEDRRELRIANGDGAFDAGLIELIIENSFGRYASAIL